MNDKVVNIFGDETIDPLKVHTVDCIEMVRFLLGNHEVKPAVWVDDENYILVDRYQLLRWAKSQDEMPYNSRGSRQSYEFDPVSKILFIGETF
jgi:hypothetical protein